jgi:hypothetical protein
MTTHLAAAEARHTQAVADFAEAEEALRAAMSAIDPALALPVAEAVQRRRWEGLAEDYRNRAFASSWSNYMKARRAAQKAASAVHKARLGVPQSAAASVSRPGLTPEEVVDRLQELRAAA